jgi:hypothetical protein
MRALKLDAHAHPFWGGMINALRNWFRHEPQAEWSVYELSPFEVVEDESGRALSGRPVMRRKVGVKWQYRTMTYDEVRSLAL